MHRWRASLWNPVLLKTDTSDSNENIPNLLLYLLQQPPIKLIFVGV